MAGLAAALLVAGAIRFGVLAGPYANLQDRLFPAPPPAPYITLIAIDQDSQRQLGAWPWSNLFHSRVIDYLASLKPSVIVVDFVLDHLTGIDAESGEDSDASLVAAISKAGNVVLACTAEDEPLDNFAEVSAGVGDRVLGLPDAANTVRGVNLRAKPSCPQNEPEEEPVFLKALRIAERIGRTPLQIGPREAVFGPHHIPLTPGGQMLINFSRGPAPSCRYIDAFNRSCDPLLITGQIVVIGTSFLDADDVHSQPVGFDHDPSFCPRYQSRCMQSNQNYGYRILGDELGTVQQGRYLRIQPDRSLYLAILVFGALVGSLTYLASLRMGALLTAVVLAAYAAVALWFSRAGWLIDRLFTPAAVTLAFSAAQGARYLLEERERRKVEDIFSQYVDPRVMQQLVRVGRVEDLRVGGDRRPLTVLFVDVRGFTSMSERLPPEEVVGLLNDFTERSTEIVFQHEGTVDKYVGDCVMAFWNAPQPVDHHADRALAAALEISSSGARQLAERGTGVGIGICTGEVVVGNVGGPDRKQYTAIGDAVNTAARLCEAAEAGTILVAGSTWRLLSSAPSAARERALKVKGKEEPVTAYELNGA